MSLVPDPLEHQLALVVAPDGARHERRVLQVRPVDPHQREPVGHAEPRPVDTTADSSSSKFSTRMFQHPQRHVGIGLEQRDRSVPELAQALIDGLQQIVGLLLPQHDVGVANDAEQMRAPNAHAREELAEIQPNDVLEQTQTSRPRVPPVDAGIGMKRGRTSGTFTRANFVEP